MLYFTLAVIVAVLSLIAVFAAKTAMDKGLTYYAFTAVVWVLVFLAIGRIWRALLYTGGFRTIFAGDGEVIEYAIYIIAYAIFIWLTIRSIYVKRKK
ncbi:MAG: hypothetical protein KGL39_21460 [Patescibacteria group bacterium]|nr:hypothetical protein [Patescibacteria group bacterium]